MSSTLVNSARLQASLLKKYPSVPKNLLFNRSIQSNSNVLSPLQTCYFRSYHTSPLSLAKDPKKDIPNFSNKKMDNKPSQNKPTQPPQQKPPQQKTPPPPQKGATGKPSPIGQKPVTGHVQTIPQGENMPRTVIRGPESIADIKKNISKLCDEEMQVLKETEGLSDSIEFHLGKEYLERTKFSLEESKEGIIKMTRTVDNQVVTVSFDRFEEPEMERDENEEAGEENEENEEVEDEEAEEEEGEEVAAYQSGSHTPPAPYKHNIQIEIAFKNTDGSTKGKWSMAGYAGKDNRLYITDMAVNKGDEPTQIDPDIPTQMIPFETLSDDLQDRLYDFLDEVGVDDQMAHFVKQYLIESEVKMASGFLQNLRDLMK